MTLRKMAMQVKTITFVLCLSAILAVTTVGAASAAPPWPDAPNAWWVENYGVTAAQVGSVADGYKDGRFGPGDPVNRGQFAKMVLNGLDIDTLTPSSATFQDVPEDHIFFKHIEGAYAEGLIAGYAVSGEREFRPAVGVQRQQANSILGRYLAGLELSQAGAIHGVGGVTYGSLGLWYQAQGTQQLARFLDAGGVATDHQPTTSYLIYRQVVQGSQGYLNPTATLNRAQAAAMVLRIRAAAAAILNPPDNSDNPPPEPPTQPLDASAAVRVALSTIPGGAVIEVERDTHKGRPVWEVLVRDPDGRGIELNIDPNTGSILKREWEELPWYVRDSAPAVDITTAMTKALTAAPGIIDEAELELRTDGRLVWEIEIVTANGREIEVYVDATTGEIVR